MPETPARVHTQEQITRLASSIKEFGFINPVLIDKDNGIIAGHGRVEAAKKLKLKTVSCLLVEHLTDTQKKAYILADNKLALNSKWDEEMLKIELEELNESNFDINFLNFDIGLNADIEIIGNSAPEKGITYKEQYRRKRRIFFSNYTRRSDFSRFYNDRYAKRCIIAGGNS